ncbi:MAG: alpha-glucosidase [Solirubrobacterales bacterium]|nr:alpha-glucosidase [Solirubrobacterales bacterium]MBV9714358.1 alpha-glucosidase [Solirubrobacterales bacterium]
MAAAVMTWCAVLGAGSAGAADQPVAACPPGKVSLSVARAAQGTFAVGPFSVAVDRAGLRVQSGGHVLWASVSRVPFVGAGKGTVQFTDGGGFYQVQARFSRCWRRQTITHAALSRHALRLTGTLGADARFAVTFSLASSVRLAMTAHVSAPGATTVLLTAASPRRDAVHGFGAMTRWNLKGGIVPILTREQGVGRGEAGVTQAENQLTPPQGGAYNTTYAVVPQYLTSGNRGFFWTDDQYGVFDLTRRDRIASQLWARTVHAQVLLGRTPAELIRAYTEYAGRMQPLPHWVDQGAIVGIQGGTDTVLARVAALRAAGVPLAGVWLQDWVGQRTTSFGSRLLWNWTLNPDHYPNWSGMVAQLRHDGIRVLTYVNPMLTNSGVPAAEPNLFAQAAAGGYLVRKADGTPYLIDQGGFSSGLVDLSNPAARGWMIGVLHAMARTYGASGWMADFGEQTPFDGVFASGSAAQWHNRYPDAWAQVQAAALRGTDVVDFHRSAFTTSPRYARLFWMGDQLVDWSPQDGMRSALTGMLSGGLSGFALNHSDTGGYTTLASPLVARSAELLARWSEMNAFGGAMLRSHEGNRPQLNVQPYSTPAVARAFAVWARVFRALGPYRQALEREAATDGMPIVRPMWLTDPRLENVTGQFTLGSDILVAPAFAPGVTRTSVELPPGRWVHVWTGRMYIGPRTVTVASPLGRPAVFTRPGRLRKLIITAARG